MPQEWLESTGLSWLRALEDENGFAESVYRGVAVRGEPPTAVTQARLGYCWSHLACKYPGQREFVRAAHKSYQLIRHEAFRPGKNDFRVYDHSFFLLFMAWYFRLTGDALALRLMKERYLLIERHLDDAGAGGFGPQTPGIRSHNPYMHLLEATLAAYGSTRDDYWLAQAWLLEELFLRRLYDAEKRVVFEFLNSDWSAESTQRVEIGHQLEWPTLLFELHSIDGKPRLTAAADALYEFALRYGFEDGDVIDAVNAAGERIDGRKLLWSQMEAARHFSVRARLRNDADARTRSVAQWARIRDRFFHANGWSWHNRISAEGVPVHEPSVARLLYHVVTAAADAA